MEEILYICELSSFYGLKNDRLKNLAELQLKNQIDKFNVVTILDMSERLGASKIKKLCLHFLAQNFELFAGPELVGSGSGNSLSHVLAQLDREILLDIIKVKAEYDYK